MNKIISKEVEIHQGTVRLPGILTLPKNCLGIVIFAHGSGSTRMSPRNIQVARELCQGGIGTLLFDLLTPSEAEDRENIFDIPLLARRLELATYWVTDWMKTNLKMQLPLGYFGASTGGGAALWAAAQLKKEVRAVVSRGGRPDLALSRLSEVSVPTLLIVGSYDEQVIELNQMALKFLNHGKLVIIPRATHLFEEPGALEAVGEYAKQWFVTYFAQVTNLEIKTENKQKRKSAA